MSDTILTFQGVHAGYGRVEILKELSFSVERGQVLGIIGPNGSGKTTMLNALSGMIRPSSGRILYEGEDISSLSASARCRRGIARTFQIPRPFERMSVYENVLAAAVFGAGMTEKNARGPAMEVLQTTGLTAHSARRAGELTLLDRKRLEIARAMASRPKLLLLDEVAAGLTVSEVDDVIALIRDLRAIGFTILWIEHMIYALLQSVTQMLCMAEGQAVIQGDPLEVVHSDLVKSLYLGSQTEDARA